MESMDSDIIGRTLLIFGAVIALVGALVLLAPHIPFIGRLPGDISIERDGFSLFFPIATSIIISIVLTIVINLALRLK